MQTTLLGLAIAVILAFVAALIAPLVVDWNSYRSVLEAEASRLTGLNVRVYGAIDARILPTPRIKLRDVAIAAPGREPQLRAGALELEIRLAPLLRRELQASEVRLVAPQISLGIDRSNGTIDWSGITSSFPLDKLSISRLSVENGRVTLSDATSGSRLLLQKLSFNGDVRSPGGAFMGEGAFFVDNKQYGYRISGARADEGGGLKLRLAVDPGDYPLTTEVAGSLVFDNRVPRFDGAFALARPAGAALAHGRRVINVPWRLAGRIRVSPAAASLQKLAFQYGPDERAVNFTGKADLTFGAHPHLRGTISAGQVDVDRALAAPDLTHRPPLLVAKSFLETVVATVKPPIAAELSISIGALTVGNATIESLHGNVRFDDKGWGFDGFEFHAPGMTEVNLTGQLDNTPRGLAFSGPASVTSGDLKMLVAWLEGRSEPHGGPAQALSAQGDVTIGSDRFAFDRLTATLGPEKVEGRLTYTWAAESRPATLDGDLHAAELNIDALTAFASAALNTGLEVPHDVALNLAVGKATFAGLDARTVNARLSLNAGVLHVNNLSVGDLGGAAIQVHGSINDLSSQPRGHLTLDLDAKALGGLLEVIGEFAPQTADSLRRVADRMAPAKVHGVLAIDRAAAGGGIATLNLGGQIGALRVSLAGDATGELSHPAAADMRITASLDGDDGSMLVKLLGLDHVIAVDQLPGQIKVSASGSLNGDVHVNGLIFTGGFSAAVEGALRLFGAPAPIGSLQLKLFAADLSPLHRGLTGQSGVPVPVSAHALIAVSGGGLSFRDLGLTAGKASLHGRLALKFSNPIEVDGDIEADNVYAPAAWAMLLGMPSVATGAAGVWSAQPVGTGAFAPITGSVAFKLDHAAFTSALVARDLKGVVRLEPSSIALKDIGGTLAGGRLAGGLVFRRDSEGLAAQGQMELAGADVATLFASNGRAVDGQLTLKLRGDGAGLSPQGIIGSLHGGGAVTLTNSHLAGLDAAAFDAAIRAADQNGSIEPAQIRARVSAAMAAGRLAVPLGSADVTIAGGQIHLANARLPAQSGAELVLVGGVNLVNATIEARMTLLGQPSPNALIAPRPEVSVVVKGAIAAPQRTVDVSALVSWLTLRNAELQTRRLESLEANRREDVLGAAGRPAPPPAAHIAPLGTALKSAAPASPPASAPGTRSLDRLRPELPAVAPDDTRATPRVDDASAKAGTLEPNRQHPATPQGSLQQTAQPPTAPAAAPVTRAPWDFLFHL